MSSYSILSINANIDFGVNSNDAYEFYTIDANSNNIVIDLSTNYWEGLYWQFQRLDNTSNTVVINAPSGKTINGSSSISLSGYKYIQLIYTNGNFICYKISTTI